MKTKRIKNNVLGEILTNDHLKQMFFLLMGDITRSSAHQSAKINLIGQSSVQGIDCKQCDVYNCSPCHTYKERNNKL